jgi:predicted transcriptional regulator
MAYKRKPNAAELAEKIKEAKGNVSAVARAYHVTRTAVYGWIQSSAAARDALADEREQMVDVAESVLFKQVVEGNMTAVAYTLNNSPEARRRGWGMQHRVEHSGDTQTTVRVIGLPEQE